MAAESTQPQPAITEPGTTPRRRGKGRRRKAPSTGRKALRATAWTAAGVVVLGGAGAGYLYFKLNGNLHSVDINQALGSDRPTKIDNGSENILVLGSDTRAGKNKKLGGGADDGSARSDTAMIVHVYEGHKKASVVSIPRDTLVDRPRCTDTKGTTHPAASGVMFNEAYSTGGAACAVKTVESITGIRMDHYLEVDFEGFQKLIDDLGGVRVTTTKDIKDPQSHLNLKAGAPHPRRRTGPRSGPHPARRGRRLRPGPHPAPAGLHQGADRPGQARRRLHEPGEAVRPRRHRHQGRHHRLRTRLGQLP